MDRIKSYLITEQLNHNKSNKETTKYFRDMGVCIPTHKTINFMSILLRTEINHKHYFCCMSGGEIINNNEAHLTYIGRKTFEALERLNVYNLPFNQPIYFQQIFLGKTPLRKKIIAMLSKLPSGSKVCFVGDMSGSLDGVLFKAFNVCNKEKK